MQLGNKMSLICHLVTDNHEARLHIHKTESLVDFQSARCLLSRGRRQIMLPYLKIDVSLTEIQPTRFALFYLTKMTIMILNTSSIGPPHISHVHAHVMLYPDDVIKWKYQPRYWPFVRGIHRSPVDCPHKCQWRDGLVFFFILNKRWSKQSRRRWFETPLRSLWRHCNDAEQWRW